MNAMHFVGIAVISAILASIGYVLGYDFVTGFFSTLPISFIIIYLVYRCWKCGASWAKVPSRTEVLDRYTKDKIENGKKVQVRTTKYIQYYKCKNCRHETSETKTSEETI